jgi:beta-mannanase
MFEQHAGKGMSIMHWGQAWYRDGQFQAFEPGTFDIARSHGSIPMINWNPWDSCCGPNQPTWKLSSIISGTYDSYITQWATAGHAWGHPLFVRMMDEMNGSWYPWSEAVNGNRPGEYVQAWRHIRGIFTAVGATNVYFVWCPNTEYSGSLPLEGLYPGDSYVDWVAIDGYNWGTNPAKPDVWASFAQVFGPTYNHLGALAPTKPVMIAETASTEDGGSKATWITDALTNQIPNHFPRIKAVVWFNWDADSMDWVIETSSAAQAAFANGIASPYYASNTFGNLNREP